MTVHIFISQNGDTLFKYSSMLSLCSCCMDNQPNSPCVEVLLILIQSVALGFMTCGNATEIRVLFTSYLYSICTETFQVVYDFS